VTKGVIELLEMIDVRHKQTKRLTGFHRLCTCILHGDIEFFAVGNFGQTIGQGFVLDGLKIFPQSVDFLRGLLELSLQLFVLLHHRIRFFHHRLNECFHFLDRAVFT